MDRFQPRVCAQCERPFLTQTARTRFCSQDCWQIHRKLPKPCAACGAATARYLCENCRAERRRAHYLHKNYQRRHVLPPPAVRIGIDELGDRDGWRCHICRRRVDKALKSPHPMSATMDHLIPASNTDESSHEPVNLALAHRICNIRRSNRGPAQLALIG